MRMQKRRKKDTFYTSRGRAVLIATSSNLLDTKYKSYGFNIDLRETINTAIKLRTNTDFVVICKISLVVVAFF